MVLRSSEFRLVTERHGILSIRMEIMDLLSVRGVEFNSLGSFLDSAACCSDP
jgi:hypothetical protein